MTERYEAVVIGTGFGGSVCACRLSKRWPGKVLVLERGKRYPLGSFPRKPRDVARNFGNVPDEGRSRPRRLRSEEMHGMFDVRTYRKMDVLVAAGLGGGSLIYANVFMEPPEHIFDDRWPESCKRPRLDPYFRLVKDVLGSRPIPVDGDPRRQILRTELFQRTAKKLERDSQFVDINVFFGLEFDKPLPIGHQQTNRYGALQTSCVYCAECNVGCNYHAKNTLDLNYLHVAERRYQAKILTETLAERIVPLNADGDDDPSADGSHGYHVYYRDLNHSSLPRVARADRVVLSAGTLGSTELLLRCREVYKTLPRISGKLGTSYSGNGDFLSFVVGTDEPADPNYGPVITQRIDFNLFKEFDRRAAFILEDACYPSFAAWFAEGAKPGFLWLGALWRFLKHFAARFFRGRTLGGFGYAFADLLSGDLAYNTAVLLCMGVDRSDGMMSLDRHGRIMIDWPTRDNMPLYRAIVEAGGQFKDAIGARLFLPIPTWWWPFRKNVTVHSLGGCILADSSERGVTSASRADFGQVFGYRNLYVADGAIVPTAVGANPSCTITALSEMVAQSITGFEPDADL